MTDCPVTGCHGVVLPGDYACFRHKAVAPPRPLRRGTFNSTIPREESRRRGARLGGLRRRVKQ